MNAEPRVSVLIPAFESAQTLPVLIREIKENFSPFRLVVIDDGSSDPTCEAARLAGAECFRLGRNSGKGAALKYGISLLSDSDWIICLDSDLQHDPADLPVFFSKILTEPADLILGMRNLQDPAMPFSRRFSNTMTSLLITTRLSQDIADSQCGYRAIRVSGNRSASCRETGYMFETELLVKTVLSGGNLCSVPVRTIYNSSKSYLHPWVNTVKFLNLLFRSIYWN